MGLECSRVFPDVGPSEDQHHWAASALRDDFELDPAISLAADAIARHSSIACDRVDEVIR
jgi:hypothetical protein